MMCGVVGALGAKTEQLVKATRRLHHRGIRADLAFGKAGGVGHVRLPIVGLGTEHDQPMQRGPFTIGFVGELLDFREHHPGMECDAELVADTWHMSGAQGFTKHDGFWGIIAIDNQLGALHILTDYLGQKPMYYRIDTAAAASEPAALLEFGPVTLDYTYLSACVKWGYCPDVQRTPYNEIKHVLPGEHVVLGLSRPWSKIVDPLVPVKDSASALWNELELAVKRRVLSSDVPVACLVSGGVDSSLVYALASRHHEHIVPYFAQNEKGDDDEDYWNALQVTNPSKAFAHFSSRGDLPTVMKQPHRIPYSNVSIDEVLAIMQEPIDLGSLRPQIALARAIGETVCLTGDGADELFGGYERSTRYDSQYSDVFMELPAWHLPRLDRAMMRKRVEVRSPFLARRVAQMALGLPHAARMDKVYLRALAGRVLPPSIAGARKKALRTAEIAHDRETHSKMLVEKFIFEFKRGSHAAPPSYTEPTTD